MNHTLSDSRSYKVVKSNDLIQKSRFNLSLQEQKIILYLISRIKPMDMDLKEHAFQIVDFCKTCGLDESNGANYKYIKETLKGLRDKSIWIELTKGSETTLGWLSSVTIDKGSGLVKVNIDDKMKPFLLDLKGRFTEYEILYILAMKSQYSIRLFELLRSYEYTHSPVIFDIDVLKKKLCAETYDRYPDFKRKVLDIAMREINHLSDIKVSYEIQKEGRRYARLVFSIELKKDYAERLNTFTNIEKVLNPNEIPGQLRFEDIAEVT